MIRLFIDADGCPVVSEAIFIAQKYDIKPFIFCDTSHEIKKDGAETIIISKGADAVDFALLNRMKKNDIVVTQDYGLAAMVLAKGGYCINQDGQAYTNDNIDQLLFTRHIGQQIRQAGGRTKGPKKRDKKANQIFQRKFEAFCMQIVKEYKPSRN